MLHIKVGMVLIVAVLVLLAVAASASNARFVQQGKLLVSFEAGLEPTKLSRDLPTPVRVGFRGTFENLDASDTPALRTMRVRLARGGEIYSKGLPRCPLRMIRDTSSSEALSACRGARVGDGVVTSAFRFPDGQRVRARAKLLLFNIAGGMVMHVYTVRPLEGTFLVPMRVRRTRGDFGTVLTANFPQIAAGYGYLTGFRMVIDRTYRYAGQRRSYVQASCPIPDFLEVKRIQFELARVTYRFAGGVRIDNSSFSVCRVTR